jgi:hypothetical protein
MESGKLRIDSPGLPPRAMVKAALALVFANVFTGSISAESPATRVSWRFLTVPEANRPTVFHFA